MRVLYVFGDDYAALQFEESEATVKGMWEKAYAENNQRFCNDAGTGFDAYEFGEVDQKFIDFIQDHVMDYDDSKHANFYILEEKS